MPTYQIIDKIYYNRAISFKINESIICCLKCDWIKKCSLIFFQKGSSYCVIASTLEKVRDVVKHIRDKDIPN